jgi:hypothetical protein
MYKVVGAESCSGGDTQQPATSAASQTATASQSSTNPSLSHLYTVVNKEVEQQFSGRGMTL